MDWSNFWAELWQYHRGKIVGIFLGLLIGISLAVFGFWRTLLVAICIIIGYFIGKKIDGNFDFKEFFGKFSKR